MTTKHNLDALFKAFAAIASVVFMSLFSVYCWGASRGFDLSDEGDFLLSSTNPGAYPQPSSYAFFMARLPLLLADPIQNYRIDSLLAEFCSSAFLASAAIVWLKRYVDLSGRRWQLLSIVICSLFGSLLFASVLAPTIAYTIFTAFFVNVSVACLLLALAAQPFVDRCPSAAGVSDNSNLPNKSSKSLAMALLMVAAGMALGFSFFAKFTSAACLYALTVAIIIISMGFGRVRALALHLSGVVLAALIYFGCVEQVSDWWQRIKVIVFEMELGSRGSHAPSEIFKSSMNSAVKHIPEIVGVVLSTAILLGLWRILSKIQSRTRIFALPVIATFVLMSVWAFRAIVQHEQHSSIVYWPVILIGLAFLTCCASTNFEKTFSSTSARLRCLSGLTLLALLPFVVSFGTNGSILWHIISSFAPMFLAVGLVSLLIEIESGSSWFSPAAVVLICGVSTVQFVNGYMLHFKNGPSLFSNSVCLAAPARMRHIKLESNLAYFIADGYSLLCAHGFRSGDPILGFYDLAGFVYAVDGVSPMFARYAKTFPVQNEFFLSRLPCKKWERLFLIINDDSGSAVPDSSISSLLKRADLEFPAKFQFLGKVYRPNQYWRGGGSYAYFYALKTSGIGK